MCAEQSTAVALPPSLLHSRAATTHLDEALAVLHINAMLATLVQRDFLEATYTTEMPRD